MPASRGTCFGPYEIDRLLGAGSTGEVYRARDTKLHRDVAIKILLPALAANPERLARFHQEAQILASLNHPHIAQIHGFEEAGATHALVMELVDGPTLADRIARGALPIDDALSIARQIALALEAAHGRGIIHRDLKPANIKIREDGTVKVLDFGLAKSLDSISRAPVDPMDSPPPDALETEDNVLLGTAAYMSPEQAQGRPVDTRADLWAFGAVVYEMLTGQRAFTGEDVAATLTHVLTNDPDWTRLPAGTPVSIRRLLRRCLERDRRGRLDSASGARLEIDDALASPAADVLAEAAAPIRRLTRVAIAGLAGGAAIAALAAWALMRPALATPLLPSRFAIVTPPGQPLNVSSLDRDLALSPDGRHLVYRAGGTQTGGSPLMVRTIDQLDARLIAGVVDAYGPFVSPDSRWIGFVQTQGAQEGADRGGTDHHTRTADRSSRAVRAGATTTPSCSLRTTRRPACCACRRMAVPPTQLTTPDTAQHEEDHLFPSVLPGGRGVIFTVSARRSRRQRAGRRARFEDGASQDARAGANQAEYVAPPTGSGQTGYLVYAVAGGLRAVGFDPVRLELLGDPVTVVDRMMTKRSGATNYTASRFGTIAYVPEGAAEPTPMSHWYGWIGRGSRNRSGCRRGPTVLRVSRPTARVWPSVSSMTATSRSGFWILARETQRRLTFSPGMDALPLWTPDGRRIIFMSTRSGVLNWYSQAADGAGAVERLTTSANEQRPTSITSDATRLFGFEVGAVIVAQATMAGGAGSRAWSSEQMVQPLFNGFFPEISPDGRFRGLQVRRIRTR